MQDFETPRVLGCMKANIIVSHKLLALVACASRSVFSAVLMAVLMDATVIGMPVKVTQTSNYTPSHMLNPGDIVYADSGDAIDGGFIIKVDPATGQKTVISSGGYLRLPFDVVIDGEGQLIVSDSGRLISIDPDTGNQTLIVDNSGGTLGLPYGIALNSAGQLLAANLQAIVQVDPLSGQIGTVSSGGSFLYPLGVTVADNGELFVLNMAFPAQIVRVNPQNGTQKVISQGQLLNRPQAITISGSDIFVTDVATPDGNFGVGRVIHINAHTGNQTVVAQGYKLVGPVGIAIDQDGQLIVGDPYTSPGPTDGAYNGGIIRIDPASGAQIVLAYGEGSFVNPRGIAIVQGPAASH
jgi:sugar lactone lactonase YvrE